MTSGVQCKIHRRCPHPAPVETRICSEHRKLIRLATMRQSPGLSIRLLGHALTLLADRGIEAGSETRDGNVLVELERTDRAPPAATE